MLGWAGKSLRHLFSGQGGLRVKWEFLTGLLVSSSFHHWREGASVTWHRQGEAGQAQPGPGAAQAATWAGLAALAQGSFLYS